MEELNKKLEEAYIVIALLQAKLAEKINYAAVGEPWFKAPEPLVTISCH